LIGLQTLLTTSGTGFGTSMGAFNAVLKGTRDQIALLRPREEKAARRTQEEKNAAEKYAEAMKEVNSAGIGWQGTLATMNGETIESIKWGLEAGGFQTPLATIHEVSAVKIKAVASAMQDAAKAETEWQAIDKAFATESNQHFKEMETETARVLKLRNQAVVEGNDAIMAATAKLHDYEMKSSMDTATYQIMKIWEKADAEVAAFKGTAQQAKAHADLVYTLAAIEAQGITDVMAGARDPMLGEGV